MTFQTGTLYIFMQQQAETLVARTTDIRELKKFLVSDCIAVGQKIQVSGKNYEILNIVIEPVYDRQQMFSPNRDGYDFGQGANWTVQTTIYLSPPK
jgi:hypothetical protein